MQSTVSDCTEAVRRRLRAKINDKPAERRELEGRYDQVWDPAELARDFEVVGFGAPLAVVRRKNDRQLGSVFFQHHPRYYFDFEPHRP